MSFRPNWYEEPSRRRPQFLRTIAHWSGMKTIMVFTGVMYLIQMLVTALGGIEAISEMHWWLALRTGDGVQLNLLLPAQLFTYQLLHSVSDIWHLLWNMFFLWVYGQFIEPEMGKKQFLKLYIGSGVVGGLVQWGTSLGALEGQTVGASAAVYGVMAMAAFRHPHRQLHLIFPPIPVPIWLLFGFRVIMDVLALLGGGPTNVALAAHLGGAVYGWLWHKKGDVVGKVVEKRKRDKAMKSFQAEAAGRREMDEILAKIQATGLSSLTKDERAFLDRRSRELRKDA